jgi:hypothetical protein
LARREGDGKMTLARADGKADLGYSHLLPSVIVIDILMYWCGGVARPKPIPLVR